MKVGETQIPGRERGSPDGVGDKLRGLKANRTGGAGPATLQIQVWLKALPIQQRDCSLRLLAYCRISQYTFSKHSSNHIPMLSTNVTMPIQFKFESGLFRVIHRRNQVQVDVTKPNTPIALISRDVTKPSTNATTLKLDITKPNMNVTGLKMDVTNLNRCVTHCFIYI
jgi:hypothetical protein